MRSSNLRLLFVPSLLLAFAGCGGGGGGSGKGGMGGGAAGTGGSGTAGTGGAVGAAGTGGAVGAAGTTGAAGTGGGAAGTGGGVGGTGGTVGAAGTGGGVAGTGGGTAGTGGSVSCVGFDIDVPSALVTGTLKINGVTTTSLTDTGNLSLRNAAGDVATLGATSASSYSVRVVPGTYDLVYQVGTPGATAPRNTVAKLRSVTIGSAGTTALDIDVPSVIVTGTIKINGATVTSTTDMGALFLRNSAGDNVTLANSSTGSYSVRVIPGNYDVYYVGSAPGAQAPRNTLAKLQSVVVAATGTTALDIDIPSVVVSGTLKVNGAAVASTTDAGTISLRNAAGDTISLGSTAIGSYSVRAVPGTYDVYYTVIAAGAQTPRNTAAKLQSVVVAATGTTALDVDVPSVIASGTIKINGAAVASTTDTGNLSLRTAAGDIIQLGATSAGSFSVRVVPGSYDVYYVMATPGAQAPRNALAKLQSVAIAAAGTATLDIDVPSAVATGTIKIAGTTVTSTTDAGVLSLRTAAGDVVNLGSTATGSYSARVIPGTYDLYYGASSVGALAPRNTTAKVRTGVVVGTGTTAIDIDIPSTAVTGSFRINSATVTSTAESGIVQLRAATDLLVLGNTSSGTYSTRVIPGNYDVYYLMSASGTLAPRNGLAKVRCFTVP